MVPGTTITKKPEMPATSAHLSECTFTSRPKAHAAGMSAMIRTRPSDENVTRPGCVLHNASGKGEYAASTPHALIAMHDASHGRVRATISRKVGLTNKLTGDHGRAECPPVGVRVERQVRQRSAHGEWCAGGLANWDEPLEELMAEITNHEAHYQPSPKILHRQYRL